MDKEDKQIIDRATKEEWRIGDRTRLKHLLEKNLKLYRENEELKAQIEKMKNCNNCKYGYCGWSSQSIDKDGRRTCHAWNKEKQAYCDIGNGAKYQLWEIKENE